MGPDRVQAAVCVQHALKATLGQLVSALSVPVGVLPTPTLRRVSRATAAAVAWMGCALCAPPVHSRTVTVPLVIHVVQGK